MSPAASAPPDPVRRFTHPKPEEDWDAIAARVGGTDVSTLQSWNLHLAMRPEPYLVTPYDIIFIEPPLPEPNAG